MPMARTQATIRTHPESLDFASSISYRESVTGFPVSTRAVDGGRGEITMNIRKALVLVISMTLVFTTFGGLVGFWLGRFLPSYYRSVFKNGGEPHFDPIAVGLGLGISQGAMAGAILGIVALAIMVWRGRRSREANQSAAVRKDMKGTRRFLKIAGILVAALVTPFIFFFALWVAASFGSDRGSPELASEWRQMLSEFDDPDAATAADGRVWAIRCENGEWMFGIAQGSHGIWRRGGGTVVTKDSNGDLRSYRGHVCWPIGSPFRGGSTESLAEVYEGIVNLGFEPLASAAEDESHTPGSVPRVTASPSSGPSR